MEVINAEPSINARKIASTIFKKCPLRIDEVLLIKKRGYEGWKKQNMHVEDGLQKLSLPR